MSPQRQSSLFDDRHTHPHTQGCMYTHSVIIQPSTKVGYACHFGSLCSMQCLNSSSSFRNLTFISRLKLWSFAMFPLLSFSLNGGLGRLGSSTSVQSGLLNSVPHLKRLLTRADQLCGSGCCSSQMTGYESLSRF